MTPIPLCTHTQSLDFFVARNLRFPSGMGSIRSLLLVLVSLLGQACAANGPSPTEPVLDFSDDQDTGDKADDLSRHPYGTWERDIGIMGVRYYGIESITLSQERAFYYTERCEDECPPKSGRFAWASSGDERYLVLYDTVDPSKSETIRYSNDLSGKLDLRRKSDEAISHFSQMECEADDDCNDISAAPRSVVACVAGFCDRISRD